MYAEVGLFQLPFSFWLSIAVAFSLSLEAFLRRRERWAVPALAVYATIVAWYLVEPVYSPQIFSGFRREVFSMTFWQVVGFFIVFRICVVPVSRALRPKVAVTSVDLRRISAERLLMSAALVWLILLAYGTMRMGGDIMGALFPIGGRSGANMWQRFAGAEAGATGALVSAASYLYILVLASFGMILPFLRKRSVIAFAFLLILISWPYTLLQGSRNVFLAVLMPTVFSYAIISRHSLVVKASLIGAAFLFTNAAFRIIISFRNTGFSLDQLKSGPTKSHLGLNMASELCFVNTYLEQGLMKVNWGLRYVQELANVVPRALWPGKSYIGKEYSILRGFGGGEQDIGVIATISTGILGQSVVNFGQVLGPMFVALVMAFWVGVLARLRAQRTILRLIVFMVGLGLTFNLGRDLTLLVLWPFVFAYVAVLIIEKMTMRKARLSYATARRPKPELRRSVGDRPVR